MRDHIEMRVLKTAEYIVENTATVRETAKVFKVSKSTVHKDMGSRLVELSRPLYQEVRQVLDNNKAERHLRGGEATREKYKMSKKRKI